MADLTTIWVVGITASTTLTSGWVGYWMAGRNEEARDNRAAAREEASREAGRAQRLQDQRHDFQRQLLLDLQDALQSLARAAGRLLMQDRRTVREHGRMFQAGEEISDALYGAIVTVQRLRTRILDDNLRQAVGELISFCSEDVGLANKDLPPDALVAVIDDRQRQLGVRFQAAVEELGTHLRRELGRD